MKLFSSPPRPTGTQRPASDTAQQRPTQQRPTQQRPAQQRPAQGGFVGDLTLGRGSLRRSDDLVFFRGRCPLFLDGDVAADVYIPLFGRDFVNEDDVAQRLFQGKDTPFHERLFAAGVFQFSIFNQLTFLQRVM